MPKLPKKSTKQTPRPITIAEAIFRHALAVEKLAEAQMAEVENAGKDNKELLSHLSEVIKGVMESAVHRPTGSFDGDQLREDLEALKKIHTEIPTE